MLASDLFSSVGKNLKEMVTGVTKISNDTEALYKDIEEGSTEYGMKDPNIVVMDKNNNVLDILAASVATQKYNLGSVDSIRNQLRYQDTTTIGNYNIGAPMAGQPYDPIEENNKEADYGDEYQATVQRVYKTVPVNTPKKDEGVAEGKDSGYREIEFICVNPKFPDATDPELQKQMFQQLKNIPGVIPLFQGWDDYSQGQMSLSAIYKDRAVRGQILGLAKRLGVKVDLEQSVSDEYVDRAIRGEHEGQQGVAEGQVDENLRNWFKEKWVRFGPDGKIRGDCARGDDSEGKPKCLPQAKAQSLGKKGRKYAAAKKRREDPDPERRGPAKNVATKKKSNEGAEGLLDRFINKNNIKDKKINLGDYTLEIQTKNDKLFVYVTTAGEDSFDVAEAEFNIRLDDNGKKYLESEFTKVYPKYQRKGIATMIYQYVKSLGYDVQPSSTQTDQGKSMWKGFRDKGVAEGVMKDLHIDLQDQQWDAIVGYVINGLKKNMDIGRIELNLYKYAGQEMFDVDQELENRGFKDIADLADHIRQHNGKYVPPTDFNLGKGVAEEQLDELKCWPGYHRVKGTKAGFPGSCAKNKTNEEVSKKINPDAVRRIQQLLNNKFDANLDVDGILGPLTLKSIKKFLPKSAKKQAPDSSKTTAVQGKKEKCPHCGGEMVSEELINEKKDACYYKVKSRYKVWPSAYASGALVKCRKKGAANWGNKSESMAEEWSDKYKSSINCDNPKGFSQKAHCAGRKKNEDLVSEAKSAAIRIQQALQKERERRERSERNAQRLLTPTKPMPTQSKSDTSLDEAVAGIELAEILYNGLEQKYPDIVRRFGHEVVGNAVMDAAEQQEDSNIMPNVNMIIDEIYSELAGNEYEDDEAATPAPDNAQPIEPNIMESRFYYSVIGTPMTELRSSFGMRKDRNGWFLTGASGSTRIIEAHRAFGNPKIL